MANEEVKVGVIVTIPLKKTDKWAVLSRMPVDIAWKSVLDSCPSAKLGIDGGMTAQFIYEHDQERGWPDKRGAVTSVSKCFALAVVRFRGKYYLLKRTLM